jgi:hypothetical protein
MKLFLIRKRTANLVVFGDTGYSLVCWEGYDDSNYAVYTTGIQYSNQKTQSAIVKVCDEGVSLKTLIFYWYLTWLTFQ